MTEDEARAWLGSHFDVSRETWAMLERFVALLLDEADRQNLISASTRDHVWARHIVDSAQLLLHIEGVSAEGEWVDLGAGAGLPGIVIAILRQAPTTLIEMRKGRVAFLEHVIADLNLGHARVLGQKVEAVKLDQPAAVISARAYAPLAKLFLTAFHLADQHTLWILPKGQSGQNELEAVRQHWQGVFHVKQSVTNPDSSIILAQQLRKKGRHR